MSDEKNKLKKNLFEAISQAEHLFSKEKYKLKESFDLLQPIRIIPFYGFGSDTYVFLKGRVLEKEKIKEEPDGKTVVQHIGEMYHRYASDEIPHLPLKAEFAGQVQEVKTDSEGYFELEFRFQESVDYGKEGKKVKLRLLEQKTGEDEMEAEAYIFVPGKDAEFGIISDIDDTVLVSKVTDFLAEWKLKLMEDASQRHPFPGIAAFLSALEKGSDGKENNPLFYVSGSPWNLFDLLIKFFEYHNIPVGPLLLRDKGTRFDKGKLETGQQEYKLKKIRHILETYPHLKFICIGDSGEHDASSYQEIQKEYPGQLLGVYIRDVSPNKRDREIRKIERSFEDAEFFYAGESFSAARHALKMGWINKDQLDAVREESKKDSEAS